MLIEIKKMIEEQANPLPGISDEALFKMLRDCIQDGYDSAHGYFADPGEAATEELIARYEIAKMDLIEDYSEI